MKRPQWILLALLLTACAGARAPQAVNSGVLVFGGTGRTGSLIVARLLARGEPVTVFARPNSDRARLAGLAVNFVVGDATNAPDVDNAVATARPRVIINAIGGRGNQQGFWDRSQMAMTAAARKHGVAKLVFLSSVGVGDSARAYSAEALERTREAHAERFRAEEDLKASGLDYLIIRTGIVAPERMRATHRAHLTQDRSVLGAVTREDLAQLTVDCIDDPACRNQTFAAVDESLDLSR
ncbi:MAG: NAD(P)H-binding protein [Steroidobacteraceae bacterium]